jgi:uncharacterized protein
MKLAIRVAVIVALVAVMVPGLMVVRNYELDSGTAALKVGDGGAAIGKLKPLARLGDRAAQGILGYAYAYGWAGVAKNDDEAMYWFSRSGLFGTRGPGDAAAPGASEALSVAKAYASGAEGVHTDPTESEKWLRFAAQAGSKEAAAELSKRP